MQKRRLCCGTLTFDQPLYLKACRIKADSNTEFNNIHLRLGGFHQLMSFLVAGCKVLEGSGLEQLWETANAKKSLPKMCKKILHEMSACMSYHENNEVINDEIHGNENNMMEILYENGVQEEDDNNEYIESDDDTTQNNDNADDGDNIFVTYRCVLPHDMINNLRASYNSLMNTRNKKLRIHCSLLVNN